MYKYYLFIINNNSYKIYKNNSKNLYKILEMLYHLKSTDLIYGINLYKTLCDTFNVKLLTEYIKDRFYVKESNNKVSLYNKNEITTVIINYSNICVVSNIKYPDIFRIFNIYNKKIFVIDYKNEYYFWLNDYINNLKLINK